MLLRLTPVGRAPRVPALRYYRVCPDTRRFADNWSDKGAESSRRYTRARAGAATHNRLGRGDEFYRGRAP